MKEFPTKIWLFLLGGNQLSSTDSLLNKNVIISSTKADSLKSHTSVGNSFNSATSPLSSKDSLLTQIYKLVKISSQWDYLAIDTLPAI